MRTIAEATGEQENAAFPSEAESADLSPEEAKQATIDGLRSIGDIFEAAIDEIDGLEPPAGLQQAHDALVDEGYGVAQTLRNLADQAEDVAPEGIEDFINTQVFVAETFASFDDACAALQDAGAQQGAEVELPCPT